MSCKPACWKTASIEDGKRVMISAQGNAKFPSHTKHPQCPECAAAELEDARLAVLFDNDHVLIEKYKKMMGKK